MNRSADFQTEEIASECEFVTFLGGTLNEGTTEAYTVIVYPIIINLICLPITSFSNALVIFAVKTKLRLKTMSNIALACLATTDCVMGVIGQPFFTVGLAVLLQGEGSSAYCPLLATSTNVVRVLGMASILHLTLMNMERYIAIMHSLKYTTVVAKRRLLCCSVFVWFVSFIVPLLLLFLGRDIYLKITNLMSGSCMGIILFCQIVIFQETKRYRKYIAAHQVSTENRKKFVKDKKALQHITTILFFLVLTYTPAFVVRMLITNSIIQSLNVAYSSLMLAVFAVILNSLINPVIYCIRIREFRVAFIEILCRKTTVQTENTKKRTFGTKNNGVTHEPGINGEVGMRKIKQQQQRGGCEQINSESNNSNNIGDNDTNKEIAMKTMIQEQQQHGRCEQINGESNNDNNIGDNDTNKEIAMKTKIQEQQQHGRCKQINRESNIGNDIGDSDNDKATTLY